MTILELTLEARSWITTYKKSIAQGQYNDNRVRDRGSGMYRSVEVEIEYM